MKAETDLRAELPTSELSSQVCGLWRQLADISGFVDDLTTETQGQAKRGIALRAGADDLAGTNQDISETVTRALDETTSVGADMDRSVQDVRRTREVVDQLLNTVSRIGERLVAVEETLRRVAKVTGSVEIIANQTRLLALNATIEAAHAGEAGKGFGVVASEVKDLAQQTRGATDEITRTLEELAGVIGLLASDTKASQACASTVRLATDSMAGHLDTFCAGVGRVNRHVSTIADAARTGLDRCALVTEEVVGLTGAVAASSTTLTRTGERTTSLLRASEGLIELLESNGVTTIDHTFIHLVRDAAQRVGERFDLAVAEGEISVADLFDRNYRPIAGTKPEQHEVRYLAFADRVLPDFQEPALAVDDAIAFCAVTDDCGYIPTHNRKYAHPQGPDEKWNTANCRNRRIFRDAVGLSGARSTKAFTIQTYRRELGHGFVLMKDVSAPIYVGGRHWGAVRLGYRA
jgi:methyl-accepting chemotaxis protein